MDPEMLAIEREQTRENTIGCIAFFGTIALVTGFYVLLGSLSFSPKVNGQAPVIKNKTSTSQSFGYDFDKDGILDHVNQWYAMPRVGFFSHELNSENLEFKALQETYFAKQGAEFAKASE